MSEVVAIIPARAGSKRLPGKNKRLLCSKPLVCWSIEQALQCDFIAEIIITTDDLDIIEICQQYYYDNRFRIIKRDEELAQDDTPMEAVILDALEGYDALTDIILLQPTSPLRTSYQIKHAYGIFKRRLSCNLISVYKDNENKSFKINGNLYIFTLGTLMLTQNIENGEFMGVYVISKKMSIDIDTLEDFELAEKYMEERMKNGFKIT